MKFLCPECKKLTDTFEEEWRESVYYTVNTDVDYKQKNNWGDGDGEHKLTFCSNCNFQTREWKAEDFLVEVNERKKTIEPYGDYWAIFNKDEFEEVVKEIGYEPLIE